MVKWFTQGLHDLFLVEQKLEPAFPVSKSRTLNTAALKVLMYMSLYLCGNISLDKILAVEFLGLMICMC